MYKLSRRRNLIPFAGLLAVGLAACMLVPPMFADKLFEIPAFALFPAEIALVMMLSVLFFENATPPELLRLSFTMLALCMFAGGMGNVFGRTSQTLPDQTLLLNWVQLICMNITGLIATIAFYQTRTPAPAVPKQTAIREVEKTEKPVEEKVVTAKVEAKPAVAEDNGESVQEILSKLDVNRINNLESSLKKSEGNVSLESLFADESHAAAAIASASTSASAKVETEDAIDMTTASLDDLLGGGSGGAKPEPLLVEAKAEAATAVEAPPVVAPKPESKPDGKLFDDSSLGGDLEDIFADLASDAANADFSAEKLAEIKATTPPPAEPPVVAETKADSKLMDVSDDDIEDIFKNIVAEETEKAADLLEEFSPSEPTPTEPAPAAVAETKPATPAPEPAAPKEVKDFGRLSAAATSKTELAAPGTLKTIGQMLLDTQAIENIIKSSEAKGDRDVKQSAATARVVTVARGADIQAMLDKISEFPGIDGALVIGKDGLLIGATQSLGMMRDVYGVLALGMHSTTNLGTKKVDLGELCQSVLRCGNKVTIMTEIGIGVLAAFSDAWDVSKIDAMLEHIGKVVTGSEASGGTALPMESLTGGLLAEEPTAPPVVKPEPTPEPPKVEAKPEPAPVVEDEDKAIPISEAKGGLLNVDDDDIGGLFDNVLADPSVQHDKIGDALNATAEALDAAAANVSAISDEDMADLLDNLLDVQTEAIEAMDFTPAEPAAETKPAEEPKVEKVEEKQPEAAKAEAPAPAKAEAPKTEGKQIKEFGRLSSSSTQAAASEGAIKAIGRQLIDVQAVENIIKSGEKREKMGAGLTTARVISQARGEGIKALLTKIDGCTGVAGSLIVGNDGLVIASTLQGGLDKDLLGALCTAMHSHTDLAVKKLQMGKTRQIIFHAEDKMTILTGVAVGVLAVFVDNHSLTEIDSLLTAIESTVRG